MNAPMSCHANPPAGDNASASQPVSGTYIRVQKSILRRTIHRRHKNRSTRASLKNLKNALRDIRRALSFENIHLVNVELSNSDSEEEDETTPNNSVDTSD
ncbi:hypothetical protein STEG23_020994 [Scotinomys teguina]